MAKSSMVRIDPHVAQMFDDLAVAMEADPTMRAKYADSNGHISRATLLREAVTRGYASLRQQAPTVPEETTKKPKR